METQRLCGKLVSNEGFANAQSESDTDRKSTRLNSSHSQISYAVFCLKKKNTGAPPLPYALSDRCRSRGAVPDLARRHPRGAPAGARPSLGSACGSTARPVGRAALA